MRSDWTEPHKGPWRGAAARKIVAVAGEFLVAVADDTKLVDALGPLPVEVELFGWEVNLDALASLLRTGPQTGRSGVPDRRPGASVRH